MIPPKTLEQMAEEYAIEATTPWHHSVSELTGLAARAFCEVSFSAGAKAALSLPEVRELRDLVGIALRFLYDDCNRAVPKQIDEALAAFDRLMAEVGE